MKEMEGQLNLFGEGLLAESIGLSIIDGSGKRDSLDFEAIKFSSFESIDMTNVDDLFSGFNDARLMTFSYDLPFISRLIAKYEYAEVLLGCEGIVKEDVNDLLALQMKFEGTSRDVIKADRYLRERIENDSARFYVLSRLSGVISHQKVYLLKADDGRTRVIFGSPNLSGRAFNGSVLEFTGYCDDRTLYEHLWTAFQILRDDASSEILKKGEVIRPGESSVEELPITKRIRTEKTILVKEADNELGSKINYAIKVNESWEKKTEEFCKSVRIKDSNVGYTLVTSDHLEKMLAKKRENEQKRRVRFRSDPQFVLDYYEQTVTYNGAGYDLNPSKEEITDSINKFIDFMNGYSDRKHIEGNVTVLSENMYKIANYMMLSPFMGKLVTVGLDKDFQNHSLPMYMLVQGQSDCGKSALVKFMHRAMFEDHITKLSKDALSTSTSNQKATVPVLISNVKGVPLYIDEMDGNNWKYAPAILKDDDLRMEMYDLENRPCFLINTNQFDLKIPKDYSKRLACIYSDETTRFYEDFATTNKLVIKAKTEAMDSAMYREYLRRMFPRVNELIEQILKPIQEFDNMQWVPDIFNISAQVLREMILEYVENIPESFREFTWRDYMGTEARASKALDLLKKDYALMPEIFRRQKDKIYIDYSKNTKNLDRIKEELPVAMAARVTNSTLIIDRKAAEDYMGIHIRYRLRKR